VKLALAALALLAAAPAWAQSDSPRSTTPPSQPPAAERRATGTKELNLNLNEADLRALSRGGAELRDPPAEQAGDGLPALGGNVRPMERPKGSSYKEVFPTDSERR
jgi:hypothetical protein